MIQEIIRLITWTKNYGLPANDILDLIEYLADDNILLTESEDAQRLEAFLREADPNASRRAELFLHFMQFQPDEEIEPEEAAGRMAFLPLFLHAVKEIVETAGSREEAVSAIDAILA